MYEKFSISLSKESLAQMEWIRENVLHSPVPVKRSQLIAWIISLAYFDHMKDI